MLLCWYGIATRDSSSSAHLVTTTLTPIKFFRLTHKNTKKPPEFRVVVAKAIVRQFVDQRLADTDVGAEGVAV